MKIRIGIPLILTLVSASVIATCSPGEENHLAKNARQETVQIQNLALPAVPPKDDSAAPSPDDLNDYLRKTPILVSQLLQQYHFARHPIDENLALEWIESYMKAFDYNHLFFFQSDLERFRQSYGERLPQSVDMGDVHPAYEIFQVFQKRLNSRVAWIEERLKKPFDFSSDEYYELDRPESLWPQNKAEADRVWERRLKYDLLQEKLASKPKDDPPIETVSKRYQRLQRTVREYDSEDIIQTYLTALAELYDPHSQYMGPSTLEDFSIGMKLALVGIGAVLSSEDGYCTVKEILPGGPADRDKRLKVNDRILAVGQGKSGDYTDIVDMKLRNAVKLIRGKKNTIVRLKVNPADATDPSEQKEIDLLRDKIELTAQQASAQLMKSKDDSGREWKVGVIELPSFYGNIDSSGNSKQVAARSTTDDVALLLKHLKKQNIDGLILDLRRNGGGLLEEAIRLTGLFIDEGPVVQVKDNDGQIAVRADREKGVLYNGPMIVLTSRHSASASEILAGALQNYERAIIVGDKSTHGKGTVQAVVELNRFLASQKKEKPNAGAVKLTIQKFYLPNGHSTQNRGVIPDIQLPSHNNYLKIGEADAPHALPWDQIKPAEFEKEAEAIDYLQPLQTRSQQRIAHNKLFQLMVEDINRLKERVEKGLISLNEAKRIEEREKEKKRREMIRGIEKKLAQQEDKGTRFVIKQDKKNPEPRVEIEKDDEEAKDKEEEEPIYTTDLPLKETLHIMTDWLYFQNHSGETLTALNAPSRKNERAKAE